MKFKSLLTVPVLAASFASTLGAQQGSTELQQQKRQLEQQEQQLERQIQQSSAEERQQLQQQKQQLQQQKQELERKLRNEGQQASAQQSQAKQSEASKDELKVNESEARKEVTDINKASKVIGMKVMNKENEEVGKIKDLAIDVQSGKIAYAVLSAGGRLGVGGKLIAVPAESLTPMPGQKGFLLNAPKDRIAQAPGFTEKDWPKMDAATEATVGLSPTGRPSSQSGRADQGEQQQQHQQQQQPQQQK